MNHILVLFDIDGTILKVQEGLSRKIFQKVFCNFFELNEKSLGLDFEFSGLTDLEILLRMSEIYSVDFSNVLENQHLLWQRILEEFKQHCSSECIFVYEDVPNFIRKLHSFEPVTLGLLTGNFYECAYFKLSLAGLAEFFPFGAFGNESVNRKDLHKIAIDRANAYFNQTLFTTANTFIIGDSVPDILSAQENNIKVVAVATGRTQFETLSRYKPDLLVRSFAEGEKIINFLGLE